ncbi:MAG: hypothetical protein ACXU82_03600 [Caulobacteraceae bacterium]
MAAAVRQAGGPIATPGAVKARAPKAKYQRRMTGLEYLFQKKQINHRQRRAGERYGNDFRVAIIESPVSIKSSLDDPDAPRGPGGGPFPQDHLEAMAWIIECREQISLARNVLGHHAGMIAACDMICGRQLSPTEIAPDSQKDRVQIETGLRIALDMLVVHYGV